MRLLALDARSAPSLAGLLPGNLITGINGFALRSPDAFARAWTGVATAQAVVIELERGGRPLVLRVDWRPGAPQLQKYVAPSQTQVTLP